MSPIVSRWPVLLQLDVTDADRDGGGVLTDAGARRLFALARDAYFERCATVDTTTLQASGASVRHGLVHVGDVVSVSAGVVEVFPESFRMSVRIRAAAPAETSSGVAADVTCTFTTQAPIPASMRDEFIALAHDAKHVH